MSELLNAVCAVKDYYQGSHKKQGVEKRTA